MTAASSMAYSGSCAPAHGARLAQKFRATYHSSLRSLAAGRRLKPDVNALATPHDAPQCACDLIEWFVNKVKRCRRLATRSDNLAANYLAFIQVASTRMWRRVMSTGGLLTA